MTSLSVVDLIREGRFETAVIRMQDLCRIQDPEIPVDADEVRAQYEATRARLRAVVPPAPFGSTITIVKVGQRVRHSTIQAIVCGRTWGWLTGIAS